MKRIVCIVAAFWLCVPLLFGQAEDAAESAVPERPDVEEASEESLILLDEDAETTGDDAAEAITVGGVGDFIRMVLVLGLVLVMIYLVLRFLKRAQQPKRPETSLIGLAASQLLNNGRSLHLVQVGQQVFLVGEGDASVQLIAEITDQESLDEIRLRAPLEQKAAGKSFGEVLSDMLQRRKPDSEDSSDSASDEAAPSLDFIQKRRQRLKDL